MSKGYTDSQVGEAEARIIKEFRALCKYDYAKFTVNMNRLKGNIEIVPEPHIKVEAQKSS